MDGWGAFAGADLGRRIANVYMEVSGVQHRLGRVI